MDLWNKVIEQLRKDIEAGEVMPMYEMLQRVPKDVLIAYLPEETEYPEMMNDQQDAF